MFLTLLKHEWLGALRSHSFGKSLAINLVMYALALFVLVYIVALAFSLEMVLSEILGISDSVPVINQVLIYYFFLEILYRYFLQKLPAMDVSAYAHLPIKRKTILHFLLGKSLFSAFNIVVPILFGPFAFTAVREVAGLSGAFSWLLVLTLISWCIHFGFIVLRRVMGQRFWVFLIFILLMVLLGGLEYLGFVHMGRYTSVIFQHAALSMLPGILFLFLLISLYAATYSYYSRNRYNEAKSGSDISGGMFDALEIPDTFGIVGDLINLEIKFIFRHKRARSSLLICGMFLFYGLLFYPGMESFGNVDVFLMIILGTFITGIFIIQYGQFLISWHSGFFDFFGVNPISTKEYITSRYYLLSGVSVISFILTIPYLYFGWQVLAVHAAMFVFNIGVNVYIIIAMSMWGPKKIDVANKSGFSYQGIGAAQWVMSIPPLALPVFIFIPFAIWGSSDMAVLTLALIGLTGILFRNSILSLCARRLNRLKYSMGAAFRSE